MTKFSGVIKNVSVDGTLKIQFAQVADTGGIGDAIGSWIRAMPANDSPGMGSLDGVNYGHFAVLGGSASCSLSASNAASTTAPCVIPLVNRSFIQAGSD